MYLFLIDICVLTWSTSIGWAGLHAVAVEPTKLFKAADLKKLKWNRLNSSLTLFILD